MKNYKGIIAVLLAFVIVFSFAACKSNKKGGDEQVVTQAVTNENGDVVIDENGEIVTEAVAGEPETDANGNTVTEVVTQKGGQAVTQKDGQPATQARVKHYGNTGGSSSSTTTKKSGSASKQTTTKKSSKTTTTKKNSDSKTTTKKQPTTTTTTTKPVPRKITLQIALPTDSGKADTLTIKINGEVVDTLTVNCDGSTYTYETHDKYEGDVKLSANLKNSKSGKSVTVKSNINLVELDLTSNGIYVMDGEDD